MHITAMSLKLTWNGNCVAGNVILSPVACDFAHCKLLYRLKSHCVPVLTSVSLILYFYRAMLCIRGTSHGPLSVCLSVSVSVSVTSRCSTKTAKRRITQTTPHDTPGTLVFCCHRSPRNSTGVTPTRAPNAGGVGQNRRLLTNSRLYLENGTR